MPELACYLWQLRDLTLEVRCRSARHTGRDYEKDLPQIAPRLTKRLSHRWSKLLVLRPWPAGLHRFPAGPGAQRRSLLLLSPLCPRGRFAAVAPACQVYALGLPEPSWPQNSKVDPMVPSMGPQFRALIISPKNHGKPATQGGIQGGMRNLPVWEGRSVNHPAKAATRMNGLLKLSGCIPTCGSHLPYVFGGETL